MKKIEVKTREKKNVVITVKDKTGKIALETVLNPNEAYEELNDLIDKLVIARDWIQKKQKHSDYKYPQLTEEQNGN